MNIHFLEEAEEEFLQAALYYEKQAKGLGQKFMNEVYQAIEYIVDFPLASAKLTENIRRK